MKGGDGEIEKKERERARASDECAEEMHGNGMFVVTTGKRGKRCSPIPL